MGFKENGDDVKFFKCDAITFFATIEINEKSQQSMSSRGFVVANFTSWRLTCGFYEDVEIY